MNRRRALIAAQDSGPKLLFELKNETVTTGTRISTNVKPFTSGRAITILLDFQNTANPQTSGGVASTYKVLQAYSSALSQYLLVVGKSKNTTSSQKYGFCESIGDGAAIPSSAASANRHRYAFTHEGNAVSATLKYKLNSGSVDTITRTKSSFTPDQAWLYIGGGENNAASLPAGTIKLAQVWEGILSDDEINAFFA